MKSIKWLGHAISHILFLCENFQHEFIIFYLSSLIFCFLSFHLSMGKSDLKRAVTKHSQNLRSMFKRKKLSAIATLNHIADPSTNVDRNVDSSESATLTPEVNINTATTEAAVSITLDVLSSVRKPGNTAITEDSVSTIETVDSTTLDVSSSVPVVLCSKESRSLIIQNLLLLVNLFSQLIQNMISPFMISWFPAFI